MDVFLKQNNIEITQIRPSTRATVLANNCARTPGICYFSIEIPSALPRQTVWMGEANINWRYEAWIDNVLMPSERDYVLVARCQDIMAELQFQVTSGAPVPTNMVTYSEHIEPLNNTYLGRAQKAVFSFASGPEQLDFVNNFFVNQYINEIKGAIKQESPIDDLLKITVLRDANPTWYTNYIVEITSTDRTGNQLPWTAIAVVAFALIITWLVIRPILQLVTDIIYGPSNGGDGGGGGGGGSTVVTMLPWIIGGVVAIILLPKILESIKRKR